jgi:cytidyltransferase-like protein
VTERIVVVCSGFFNPLHIGHLSMFAAAARLGTHLVVVVNNDEQQMRKKGRIIQRCEDRLAVVRELRMVHTAFTAVDRDDTVGATLRLLRSLYGPGRMIFANGGDRSDVTACRELAVCQELGIECVGGVGGSDKRHSSTAINRALGLEPDPARNIPG